MGKIQTENLYPGRQCVQTDPGSAQRQKEEEHLKGKLPNMGNRLRRYYISLKFLKKVNIKKNGKLKEREYSIQKGNRVTSRGHKNQPNRRQYKTAQFQGYVSNKRTCIK